MHKARWRPFMRMNLTNPSWQDVLTGITSEPSGGSWPSFKGWHGASRGAKLELLIYAWYKRERQLRNLKYLHTEGQKDSNFLKAYNEWICFPQASNQGHKCSLQSSQRQRGPYFHLYADHGGAQRVADSLERKLPHKYQQKFKNTEYTTFDKRQSETFKQKIKLLFITDCFLLFWRKLAP